MTSWYEPPRQTVVSPRFGRGFVCALPLAALLWVPLALAVYGAVRFGAWNGAR